MSAPPAVYDGPVGTPHSSQGVLQIGLNYTQRIADQELANFIGCVELDC